LTLDLYQIDAFTDKIFTGNPACVMPLKTWLPDAILLKITQENAVAETAFFIDKGDHFHLRWFTPDIEMDLCGHATLATAHALKTIHKYPKDKIVFKTASGDLIVRMTDDEYHLDFPSRIPTKAELPAIIKQALAKQPIEVFKARDYLLIYTNQKDIEEIEIDRQILDQINLDPGGLIISSEGNDCDFVSRFFTPQSTLFEDPVTGSAHCTLTPFWSKRLKKNSLLAKQISERGGVLKCKDRGERVQLTGKAKTYSIGKVYLDL